MIPLRIAGATISPDGRYRYLLWREWRGSATHDNWSWLGADDGAGQPLGEPKACLFVMLNPSTADGEKDDPTIRRCISFAKREHYDRLEVVNLFAHRATDPREILRMNDADEPYGVRNQQTIERAAQQAGIIICAWGSHGSHLGQSETVLGWLTNWDAPLMALGFTANGQPKHPLYVRGDAKLMPMLAAKRKRVA
jgi:hypothetical protein